MNIYQIASSTSWWSECSEQRHCRSKFVIHNCIVRAISWSKVITIGNDLPGILLESEESMILAQDSQENVASIWFAS